MKKYISILLVLIMLLSTVAVGYADENVISARKLTKEKEANIQYQALLTALSEENATREKSGQKDYYGGAYINDAGDLVVCMTDDSAANRSKVQTYTGNEKVLIKKVNYTLSTILEKQTELVDELESAKKEIRSNETKYNTDEDLKRFSDMMNSISGTYTDEERNTLVIEIVGLNEEKIGDFKEYFGNEEFIEFVQGYSNTTTAYWNPGKGIYKAVAGTLSTGYPVYFMDNGIERKGYITAGHGYNVNDMVYAVAGNDDQIIGQCIASVYNGNTDAALIRREASVYSFSRVTLYGNVTLSETSYTTPAQGTTIYKEGVTTQRTQGTVASISSTVTYRDGRTLTDLIKTTALVLNGDSGGVAYVAGGSIIGSVSGASFNGSSLTQSTFTYSYMTKVRNALNALDCTIWSGGL